MSKLTPVALTYLKHCSAIETARKEFLSKMNKVLEVEKKIGNIGSYVDEGYRYVYITKDSYHLYFCTYDNKIEIGIDKDAEFSDKDKRELKSKIRCEIGKDQCNKECSVNNFEETLDCFIDAFKLLIKK